MDLSKYRYSDSITVDAAPGAVYAIVADVTRMGELSPVCTSAEWTGDARSTFRGHNVAPGREWRTHCRVDVDDPGREFSFTNRGTDDNGDMVRWSYAFAPNGDGTEVTESWEVLPGFVDQVQSMAPEADITQILDAMVPGTQQSIAATLANLKAVAER